MDKSLDARGDTGVHEYGIYRQLPESTRPGPLEIDEQKEVGCLWAQPTKPLGTFRRRAERKRLCSHSAVCSREPPISAPVQNRGATGSPVAVAQSIAVAVVPNLDDLAGATSTPRVFIVSPPPEGAGSPEPVPSDRVAPFSRIRRNDVSPERVQTGHMARQPFRRWLKCPAPPVSTHTSRHCLAAVIAELPLPST